MNADKMTDAFITVTHKRNVSNKANPALLIHSLNTTNQDVLLFDHISNFKESIVSYLVSYIYKCINSKRRLTLYKATLMRARVQKSYEGMFILWMFDANAKGLLENEYIPKCSIINDDNILYTLTQEGCNPTVAKSCVDNIDRTAYDIALHTLKKSIITQYECKLELFKKDDGSFAFVRTTARNIKDINHRLEIRLSNKQYNRLWHLYCKCNTVPAVANGNTVPAVANGNTDAVTQSAVITNDFIESSYFVVAKYNLLGGLNNSLSIPDVIDATIFNTLASKPIAMTRYDYTELFGSPLNTRADRYCSPFDGEKSKFDSKGTFFKFELGDGVFVANPPFDNELMLSMAKRLVEQLDKNRNKDIFIIITLPVWDPETQKQLKVRNYNTPFPAFDMLLNCKYLRDRDVLPRDFGYYNYYKDSYSPVTPSHLLLLSTRDINGKKIIAAIKNQWKDIISTVVYD